MITDSDGYSYASIADRLLGRQEQTPRNRDLSSIYCCEYSHRYAAAWTEAYDEAPEDDHWAKFDKAHRAARGATSAATRYQQPSS